MDRKGGYYFYCENLVYDEGFVLLIIKYNFWGYVVGSSIKIYLE